MKITEYIGYTHSPQLSLVSDDVNHTWTLKGFDSGSTASDHFLTQHSLLLPRDLPSGEYQLQLDNLPLDIVSVAELDRQFTLPNISFTKQSSQFGNVVELAGYEITVDQVILTWRVLSEPNEPYRVFVHVVDEADQIIAQSDAVFANWQRPTSSWLTGEILIDTHQISSTLLQTGHHVKVGVYHAETFARLQLDSGDHVQLPILRR